MYRQIQHYRDNLSLTLNSSLPTLDLPRNGLLSRILLRFNATQTGATPFRSVSTGKWRIVDFLDAIAFRVNGSIDIVNLPGDILQYEAFLSQGITAFDLIREYSNASQRCDVLINMGDYMWDPDHFFDLSLVDNPELIFTQSLASTQWASANVDVFLGWFRDAAVRAAPNFYKRETWAKWTTAQDETKYWELPTGLPIARIIMQPRPAASTAGVVACNPNDLMYDLKLSFKNKVISVFDADWIELARQNYVELGYEQLTHGTVYHAADYYFDVGLGEVRGVAAISGARDGAVSSVVPTREGDQSYPTQKLESYEADSPTDFIARGIGYHNCAAFLFQTPWLAGEALDPSDAGYGTVELEVHTKNSSSAASGTNRIALIRPTSMSQLAR